MAQYTANAARDLQLMQLLAAAQAGAAENIAWNLALQETNQRAGRGLNDTRKADTVTANQAASTSVSQRLCRICLDRKPLSSFLEQKACEHRFCRDCMSAYVDSRVKGGYLQIMCPELGCKAFLEKDDYTSLSLSPDVAAALANPEAGTSMPEADRCYCPFPDCSALTPLLENRSHLGDPSATLCWSCSRLFCAGCEIPWRSGHTCQQLDKMNKEKLLQEKLAEDKRANEKLAKVLFQSKDAFKDLVREFKWMTCANCNRVVECTAGCEGITCRCMFRFCYECGKQWNPGHSCNSPADA